MHDDYDPTSRTDDQLLDDLYNHSANAALGPDDPAYVVDIDEDGNTVGVMPWESGAIAADAYSELVERGVPTGSFTMAAYWTNAARSATMSERWGDALTLAEFSRGDTPPDLGNFEDLVRKTFYVYATLAIDAIAKHDEIECLRSQFDEDAVDDDEDGPSYLFDELAESVAIIAASLTNCPPDEAREFAIPLTAISSDLDEAIDSSFGRWSS